MKSVKRVLAMFVILGTIVVGASTAHADGSVTCTVGYVAWTEQGGGTVQINCGGNWYYAFGSSSSCPSISSDGKKAWLSLAESAHLSGKSVTLQYSTCTGGPGLTWVELQ